MPRCRAQLGRLQLPCTFLMRDGRALTTTNDEPLATFGPMLAGLGTVSGGLTRYLSFQLNTRPVVSAPSRM